MKKPQLLLIFIVFVSTRSFAASLHFWDANGAAAGATPGGGEATGTWGTDPFWTTNPDGVTTTIPWPSGEIAVFAAGNDAFGVYTVTVDGTQNVDDIHVDSGTVTLQGGVLNLNNGTRLLSVGHKDADAVARYNTVLAGASSVIRYKQGIMIFGATNTYAGSTTIEGGVLRLGASNVMPTTSALVLANNDITRTDFSVEWQLTPAAFETDGFSQQLGTLKFTGDDPTIQRIIDFGNGASALSFTNSSGEIWDGFVLTVTNYTLGADLLRFGNDSAGLTATQLGVIRFVDFHNLPGRIDSNGFVKPALPVFLSVHRTPPSNVELTWSVVSDHNYRVQYKDNVNDLNWTDLPFDVFATGDTATYTDTTATGTQRFYQVQVLN